MPTSDNNEFDGDDFDPDNTLEPLHGVRFGEGQPINRGGRPHGSPNYSTIVRRVAMKRHRLMIDGRVRQKSSVELIVLAIRNGVAKGDIKALKLHEKLARRTSAHANHPAGVLIIPEKLKSGEWEAVYNPGTSTEFVREKYPYLLDEKLRVQRHAQAIEEMITESTIPAGLDRDKS